MNTPIVLSKNVLNTIKSLPHRQQLAIVSAIAGEMIFGAVVGNELNEEERRLYEVIKTDICRDSKSYISRLAV
ncbi:MAG: hypothetical protein K2J12_05345 [Muribaculaceae bacterium]|nr:hypothetical protein [Muribaculaceae bacterium]